MFDKQKAVREALKQKLLNSEPFSAIEVTPAELQFIMFSDEFNELSDEVVQMRKKRNEMEKEYRDFSKQKEPDHKAHLGKQYQGIPQTDPGELTFEEACRPLIRYLARNHHPHTICVVENDRAELFEGQMCFNTQEFLRH